MQSPTHRIAITESATPATADARSAASLLRGVGWLTLAQMTAGGGQFALSIILARHLGASVYGQWGFAFAFVALFAVLADFGFSTIGARDLARDKSEARRYVGNVLLLKAAMGAGLILSMAAIAPVLKPDVTVWLLVLLLGGQMLLQSTSQFLFAVFRAWHRMHLEAAIRVVHTTLLLSLAGLLVLRGEGVVAFGVVTVIAAAAALALTATVLTTRLLLPSFRLDGRLARAVLRESWPLALAMACTAVYYYADSVMLGMFRSQREVGLYAAAYVPILGLSLLVTAIRNAYLPSQSEAAARNPRDHARVLRQYGRITMMAALPAAIVGPVLAAPVLGVLYGSEFLDAAIALRLLFVTAGVMFLSSYFGSELLVRGRQRTYLVGVGAGAGTNLVLNLLLIPSFGPVGAASATLASEGLVCAFVWWQTRSGSVQVIDLALRAAGAAAVAAAAVLLAAQLTPFIVAAAVAVPAYAAALAVFDGAALRRQFPLATSAGLRAD